MSWLTSITGKAEDFLNKIDQSAANVLHEGDNAGGATSTVSSHPQSSSLSSWSTPSVLVETETKQKKHSSALITSQRSQNVKSSTGISAAGVGKPSSNTVTHSSKQTLPIPQSKSKKNSDEALFDFLNSSEPADGNKKKTTTPLSSAKHSRQSSVSSVISNKNIESEMSVPATYTSQTDGPSENVSPAETASSVLGSTDIAVLADALQEQIPVGGSHSNPDGEHSSSQSQQQLSSLEFENKLLRSEVASLNQEMASVIQRAKDSQAQMNAMKQKIGNYNSSSAQSNEIIRELQAREIDVTEALNAKDSQLAVLRIRLEESDREMQSKMKNIKVLEATKERILKDHTDSSGLQSQALDTQNEKLQEMESSLHREQDAYKKFQDEASERQNRAEAEKQGLMTSLTQTERKLTEERGKIVDLSNQVQILKQHLETAKHELQEYKDKASRILQSKEKLIASLREGSGAAGEAAGVSNLEYDAVKQERDMFREDLMKNKMNIDNMKLELQELEMQLQQESDTARDQIMSLEEQLQNEEQRRVDVEQELLKQKQELQYAIEEMYKQKTTFQGRFNDREAEIEKLRSQLATKSMSTTTESELESRVRSLTESLIQKQTMLEALSTEKNSLGLQLERLDHQYRDIQASSLRMNTTTVNVNDEDEVRQRLPTFMREGPSDTEVTRRMKRAANTIDKFSIRLGVFLRRYPIARVFVIVYMALLHLWVTFVLLTYQPEIHGLEDMKGPKPPEQ